jgi:inorganic triphosphatase YgiF
MIAAALAREAQVGTETELKLQLETAGLRRLRRHPLVQSLKRGRPVTHLLRSVYFDTPDFRLRSLGVVLRVRHIGTRRIQTLKTMGECLGGAWVRSEWESDISGDQPEIAQLPEPELERLFADRRLAASLRPIFTTEVKRTAFILGAEDWEIELALDEGSLIADQGIVPICEAELELRHGEPRQLFDLALRLQKDMPARVMTTSKSQRGYALVDGSTLAPQKARPLVLALDATAADAFQAIARSCVGQLLVNQDCLIETHAPEAVHQMRVALRRLRSAMSVFKEFLDTPQTIALREEMRWLLGHLGAARDIDVFIAEILAPLAEFYDDEPGFAALRADFIAEKQVNYHIAMQILSMPRFTQLMLALGDWTEGGDWRHSDDPERRALLDRPARDLARAVLDKRDRSVVKGLKHLAKLDPHTRHLARIEVKKLRYAVEFFTSLFPAKKSRKLTTALAELQEGLGLLNDIAVSRATLKARAEDAGDAARLWAAGMIAGWHAARVGGLVAQAAKDVKAYTPLPRFWRNTKR